MDENFDRTSTKLRPNFDQTSFDLRWKSGTITLNTKVNGWVSRTGVETMFPSAEVASLVLQILELGRDQRKQLASAARRRGISLEQLLATAITEAVREKLAVKRREATNP